MRRKDGRKKKSHQEKGHSLQARREVLTRLNGTAMLRAKGSTPPSRCYESLMRLKKQVEKGEITAEAANRAARLLGFQGNFSKPSEQPKTLDKVAV